MGKRHYETYSTQSILLIVIFSAIIAIAVWLRYDFKEKRYMGDETIAVSVVSQMINNDNWDGNWKIATWPDYFGWWFGSKDQYNFYSYHTVLRAYKEILGLMRINDLKLLPTLRITSLIYQLFAIVVLLIICRTYFNYFTGFVALSVFTVFPLIVQDCHYVRAESFVLLLAAIILWRSLALRKKPLANTLICGCMLGISMACKFSMATLVLMPIIAIVEHITQIQESNGTRFICFMKLFATGLCGFIFGFALTAPYSLINYEGYLNGVQALLTQYSSGHGPHSLVSYSYWEQANWIATYFAQTLGLPVFLLFIAGCFMSFKKSLRIKGLIAVAPIVIFYLIFCGQKVFFARNFSHLAINYCIVVGIVVNWIKDQAMLRLPPLFGNTRGTVIRTVIALLFLMCLYSPFCLSYKLVNSHMRNAPGEKSKRTIYEETLLDEFENYRLENIVSKQRIPSPLKEKVIYGVKDYNDGLTPLYLEKLERNGLKKIGQYQGGFSHLVTCTIHVYHDPAYIHYFILDR